MASPPPDVDLGKLSYEIFSLLESKFLFGAAPPAPPGAGSVPGTPGRAGHAPGTPGPGGEDRGRVRVLAIDGCGPGPGDALLAAAALARLEAALRARAGDPGARVADFFDAAAGAGAGGVLAAMLFLKGDDGRARYTAADALAFVAASLGRPGGWGGGSGSGSGAGAGVGERLRSRWAALFRRWDRSSASSRSSAPLRRVFGDATLRDTVAPLLVPCYDLATAGPFLFSRADAVESDSFDFRLRDVCAATCAGGSGAGAAPPAVRSVDGRTAIAAASGGVAAMGNPTAAAITHVLHNKHEFPLAAGVDDLLVVSIGSGSSTGTAASATPSAGWRTPIPPRSPSPAQMVRLTAEGVADMVDQAVAMAFGHTCGRNYVRIQAASPAAWSGGKALRSVDAKKAVAAADGMLTQRNVEAELFRGRRLSEKSNREKLDAFAAELVKEQERRARSPGLLPTVVIKQAPMTATPRPSSATTASSATATTTTGRTNSTMPSPASQDSCQH